MSEQIPNEPRTDAAKCRIGTRGVTRSFGPVTANRDISLSVRPSTVHAIVGENGAGKSTLMRILYGLDRPDSGSVIVDDHEVRFNGPRDAIAEHIGLVQQELAILPELTLLENLILGNEPHKAGRVDWKAAQLRAAELALEVGVSIDWTMLAAHSSIAVQQQVEILRLIFGGADVLILDEPTAVLAPAQVTDLLRLLRVLVEGGKSVLFISHKLNEILSVADEITVLRAGEVVGNASRGELNRQELAAMIVGKGIAKPREEYQATSPGGVVLSVERLSALDDRGTPRLHKLSFEVHSGEIVGIAGVAGNGQDELAETLIGVRAATAGHVVIEHQDITASSVRQRRLNSLGYVSANRKIEGLALTMSVAENFIATPQGMKAQRFGWLSPRKLRAKATSILRKSDVRFGNALDPVSSLSGGNQQRLVFERELTTSPQIIIASQPTRGVDIRGIAHIHGLLLDMRERGTAVLLFSEELDELLELSDRILVLRNGKLAGEVSGGSSKDEIGALMLGTRS